MLRFLPRNWSILVIEVLVVLQYTLQNNKEVMFQVWLSIMSCSFRHHFSSLHVVSQEWNWGRTFNTAVL